MSEFTPRQGICAYCGNFGEVTNDHIIPQCLYPCKIPADAPQVDACKHCNHVVKSAYDTNLRDLLLIDVDSKRSPHAQQLYPKFHRADRRNQSKMARAMRENSQWVVLEPEAGVFSRSGFASPTVDEQMPKILAMIVRGLYHYRTGKIFPQNIVFSGFRERNHNRIQLNIQMLNETGAEAIRIGDGSVFECRYAIGSNEPATGWVLNFYRRAVFVMRTQSPIDNQLAI